jgi:competence protein ComEC
VAVAARAGRVTAGGRSWDLGGRLVVLAPATAWSALLPGQRLRAAGRLTPPLRHDLTVAVLSASAAPQEVSPPSPVQTAAAEIRAGLRGAAAVLPDGPRGLLPGLVLGDTSALDPGLAEDFRTAGLAHLTAVSGTNCTIVTGAVLLLLRLLSAGPRTSAAVAAAALAGFVVLARPSPSVLRAAVMGGIALLALAAGRRRAALPALGAAVLGLVLAFPPLARDPGFALSVLATAGLLVLAPPWTARMRQRGVPAGVAEALAVPAAASLVTAPVVAAISGQVSLVSVPANLLAAPAVAPATVLGVLAAVVSPVSGGVAEWLARLAGLPVGWLAAVGERAARVPGTVLSWPGGGRGALVLVLVLAMAVLLLRRRGVRRVALAAAVGALLVAFPARVVAPGWPPTGWLFVACDVGQGDALVVRAGTGSAAVVDVGPDPAAVDRCLRGLRIRSVPVLLLSHLHADHVGGLEGITRGRSVGEIDVGAAREPASGWRLAEQTAERLRVPLHTVTVGERRELDGVIVDVLGPERRFTGTRSDANNSSVVLRVHTGGRTLLLTGDVEIEAQQALERSGVDLRADVVKVPHHGSAYQDPGFLAAVRASVAVISVGEGNDYGHPSSLLLAELARLGPRTVRTDRDGDVAICDDGGELTVVSRSPKPP